MNISLSSKLKISSDVLSQEVNGETVLLDLQSEQYFGLDEVGTRFWQLLQQDALLQNVFDTLQDEYDVSEQQLKSDLNDLITQLLSSKLLQLESTDTTGTLA